MCYTEPVANLTLTIDDDTLRRARMKALELDTSVNSLVREYLLEFVGNDRVMEARRRFIGLARSSEAGGASSSRTWTREELYEDRN